MLVRGNWISIMARPPIIASMAVATLLAPFMVSVAYAQTNGEHAGGTHTGFGSGAVSENTDPFAFDSSALDTIRFSRVGQDDSVRRYADRQTEFSVSLKPAKPKFSLEHGFGLNMFSHAQPEMEIESGRLGKNRLVESIPDLHDGFAYSAGIKVEHEDEDIDGTAYVSSGLLGLSYGRLGRLWYGGVDVNVEQFMPEVTGAGKTDVLNVDFTTGRRLGLTGTDSGSPLWLLSLKGNLDLQDDRDDQINNGDWTLNPSLFWQNPGFTFSAQLELPVETPSSDSTEEPDYRLRAVFEKQF